MIVRMNVLDSYVCTLDWLEPRIAAINDDQLHKRTPCSEWDVERLLDHMLWTMLSYASLGEHGRLEEGRTRPIVSGGAYLASVPLARRPRSSGLVCGGSTEAGV